MKEFFDNYLNVPKILQSKREYRKQMSRLKALPRDYQYVYKKIQQRTWMSASGCGYDLMHVHADLLDMFEEGAAAGKHVLDITGEDVASFCDALLLGVKTNAESSSRHFNRQIWEGLDKPRLKMGGQE